MFPDCQMDNINLHGGISFQVDGKDLLQQTSFQSKVMNVAPNRGYQIHVIRSPVHAYVNYRFLGPTPNLDSVDLEWEKEACILK